MNQPPSASLPPSPADGTPRFFALLYSPPALRATLNTLLALADEISAGSGRGLDHSVAHVRLDWWRGEAERFTHGVPQHPWLRALLAQQPAQRRLDLQCLVEAAAIDLASETLGARPGLALQRAVFGLIESALRAQPHAEAPSAQEQRWLADMGERACELERFTSERAPPAPLAATRRAPDAALQALRRQARAIDGVLQPRLTPLLVWVALAARQAERRARRPDRKSSSGLERFADNMVAWRAARRAARGRFRID